MITGIHALLYSNAPEETRAFFRDTLRLKSVDAGHGWLIFALPPAELGIHPVDGAQAPEMYLMCDDLERTLADLTSNGVEVVHPVSAQGWGKLTAIRIPGGIVLGLYEPRHPTALAMATEESARVARRGQRTIVENLVGEYKRYRVIGEKALSQIPDDALNHIPTDDANSAAMIVNHMSGNLRSRFTDFLTTDGEKPWRQREAEFEAQHRSRAEVDEMWAAAWTVLESELAALTDADLTRTVTIRQQPLSVHAALCRSVSHVSYHVGQIVLLARMLANSPWHWISIPKGQTAAYNANPTMEKGPR
jgi:uncharacterized damage-inducible protein DinB